MQFFRIYKGILSPSRLPFNGNYKNIIFIFKYFFMTTIYRRTILFYLYPQVEFSFTKTGNVYKLVKRETGKGKNKYILTLRKNGTRKEIRRRFSFEDLRKTYVFLRDDMKSSVQPPASVSLTYLCC